MNNIAYRYANVETALKMLESQELWFTDLRKMNDWDEYNAGFRIVCELIRNELPEHSDILDTFAPERMQGDFQILICSFSSRGDCLNMWNGYGDHGLGASVGYSTSTIETFHLFSRFLNKGAPIAGKVEFQPIMYSEETFKQLIRHNINRVFSVKPGLSPEETQRILNFRKNLLRPVLTRLCTLYKHEFFEDEREVRGFILADETSDKYKIEERPTEFGTADYHKISSAYSETPSIEEIVLGPKCKMPEIAFREKLDELGLHQVKISKSRGTYR